MENVASASVRRRYRPDKRLGRSRVAGLIGTATLAVSAFSGVAGASSSSHNATSSVSNAKKAPLVICEDAELTGSYSSLSLPETYGAQAEVDHLNSIGGVLGHKLQLVQLDDQTSGALSAQVAQECVQQYHAWAVIGLTDSTDVIPAIPILNAAHVITWTWDSGWNFPDSGLAPSAYEGYVFPGRAASSYSDYLFLNDYVVPHHLKRVAIVQTNSASAIATTQAVDQYIQGFKLDLTDTETIQTGQTNLSAVVVKLLNSNPQAIVMAGIAGTTSVAFIDALHSQSSSIPAGLCSGCTTSSFIDSVGGPSGMANIYDLGVPADLLHVLPNNKANAPTINDIKTYYLWMRKEGFTGPNQIDSGSEGWNSVEAIYDAAVSANSIQESALLKVLQHEHDDTTGQLWRRTTTHYDQLIQQNAVVEIKANGSKLYLKSPSSDTGSGSTSLNTKS